MSITPLSLVHLSFRDTANSLGAGKATAEAWLPQFEGNDQAEIKEDSREVRGYNMIVSLLWIDECI
jgi:hypothetical protein